MGQSVCTTLYEPLKIRSPAGSLAARCDTPWDSGKGRARHSKNIGVKIMCMNDVNFALSQEAREAQHLFKSVAVVEAGQREFRDVSKSQGVYLIAEHSAPIQTGDMHAKAAVISQKTRQLHSLAFRAAFVKATDQM
jgi:hypothetical protein